MRLVIRLFAAAVIAASTLAAHADTFQYKIINFGDTVVFDESAILQGDTTISSFISSTNSSVISVEIDPTLGFCAGGNDSSAGACVVFQLPDGVLDIDDYDLPFNTIGTFTTVDGGNLHDEVVITDLGPSASPVPEPSTFVLLGTGLIGAAGVLRRKLLPS